MLRRKRYLTSGEGGDNEEFTEETVTSFSEHQTEHAADWGAVTEDNPLFATERFEEHDGDAFESAFEESGFFQEA